MAVDKRIEMNPDGSFSVVFEDKDGSGDLDRIMGDLCKKHREAKLMEQELLQPMSAEMLLTFNLMLKILIRDEHNVL